MANPTFNITDIVSVKGQEQPNLAVVVEMKNTLGYYIYTVSNLYTGENTQHSRLDLEAATPEQMTTLFGDVNFDEDMPCEVILSESVKEEEVEKKSRFQSCTDEEIDQIQYASKSSMTHRQTRWGVKLFTDWFTQRDDGDGVNFEDLPAEEVANLLKRFYAEVRSQDGQLYSKKSLLSIRAALFRHLTSPPHNKTYDILHGALFHGANSVLTGQCRILKKSGLDKATHYPPITEADIEKMYSSNCLSNTNPKALQRKVFFEILLHFGRRGQEGLRSLTKEQFVFKQTDDGKNYATLDHNPLEKNHQGNSERESEHMQIMFATDLPSCPLKSLKLYLSKLNPNQQAFFQRHKDKNWRLSTCWYMNIPVGKNQIAKMMSFISEEAGLSMRYTNHSVRSTCVTTLRNSGVETLNIMAVTGHRSMASVESYARGPSMGIRAAMSSTLSKALNVSVEEDNLQEQDPSDQEQVMQEHDEPEPKFQDKSNEQEIEQGNLGNLCNQVQVSDQQNVQNAQSLSWNSSLEATRNMFTSAVFNHSVINIAFNSNN